MSFFEELKRRNVFRVGIAYGVATWLLIQVTDTVFPRIGLPDSAVTLVIALLAIGFIPALIFAWAFEMTPEGIKRDADVNRAESITPKTAKKLDRVIIAGLVLVIAGMGVERLWFAGQQVTGPDLKGSGSITDTTTSAGGDESLIEPDPSHPAQQSVAVLPFTAMSSGEDDGYFSDGLTEEILNSLAALPELLVTARTSSFHFKGQNIPVPEIAKTLGVANVVEGSVRRSGENVRITAQLVRASDGFHLWSDTYDRTLEDVFAVQEEIAENIAQTLNVVLDEDKRNVMRMAGIRDVEAFIAYQKGLEGFREAHADVEGITGKLEAINPYFETALAAAPDLVAARILKADAAGHKVFELATNWRQEAWPGEGLEALEALRLEYELAWKSASPGNQRDILEVERSVFADNWIGLRSKIERALLPGDCPATNWTVEVANAFGMTEQVIEKTREELRCDPYNSVSNFFLVFTLNWAGKPDEALRVGKDALERGLGYSWIEDAMLYALLAKGELADPRVAHASGASGWMKFPREILILAKAGEITQATELAEKFWASDVADDWSSTHVAAVIGDRDKANEWASHIDSKPGGALVLSNLTHICACGAPFDLEATPNFKAKIEQAGLDWPPRTAINFPAKDW
ncbi:MAG: hypothetical protein HKO64_12655 [Xanthomonadales bacterium]|nr:hypothetical protein [Gammaproteobacteria bacterium]NNE06865.1 hypothetical protein [Xanthomonadales bacterium]NNL96464.1 hypothetical protein [Xanthomonadales bacterium]